MSDKTAKSSSVLRGHDVQPPHRRPKISLGLMLRYWLGGFGDRLYYFGCRVIRGWRNFFRAIRRAFKRSRSGIGRTVRAAVADTASASTVAEDLISPFTKLRRSAKSLSVLLATNEDQSFRGKLKRVRLFLKYGWMWNKHLVGKFLNYALPFVCFIICGAVIYSMLNLNYALEVNYNGQMVGYVSDESVYDSAKKIIQNRMVKSADERWDSDATLKIVVVNDDKLSTQDVMANSLLAVSGTKIAEATGLYIGGQFYGATAATALLQQDIDSIIAPYESQASALGEGITVRFARNVELISGVYPVDSIMSYEDMRALIYSTEPRDIYYTVQGTETAADIAAGNGVTVDRLKELNPYVDVNALTADTPLLVATGEPLLNVKTVKRTTSTVAIAFETTVVRDSRFGVGYISVITQGVSGEKTVTSETVYENGVETSTTVISEEVTRQAVNQEVIVGSKAGEGQTQIAVGSGTLTWPTGEGYRVSRGWSSYHFGIDIAAPYGTPIYAADNGVVYVATQTAWDYGIYLIVDHQNGMQTLYGHLSAYLVSVGETVSKGQLIGLMGSTGNSTGNHLHFEVRVAGQKTDPAPYLYGYN